MKIGILTYHRSINYGAYVQAYALQKLISKILPESQVEIIDYDSKKAIKYYRRYYLHARSIQEIRYIKNQRKVFFDARKNQVLSSEALETDNLRKFQKFIVGKYDLIIVGSDEVWSVLGFRGFPNAYWLPDVTGCRKMAFAISARNDYDKINEDKKTVIRKLLGDFSFISLRDDCSCDMMRKILNSNKIIYKMCDPTMAYSFSFDEEKGKKLIRDYFGVDTNRLVLGVMDEVGTISKYLVENYKNDIQIVSLYKYVKGLHNAAGIDPLEWVQIISVLDGLLTSFFHGMCVAINANTPFSIFEYRDITDSKMSKSYDLLSQYGFEHLYYQMNHGNEYKHQVDEFIIQCIKNKKIDYSLIKKGEVLKFDQFKKELLSLDSDK